MSWACRSIYKRSMWGPGVTFDWRYTPTNLLGSHRLVLRMGHEDKRQMTLVDFSRNGPMAAPAHI